MAVYFSHFLNEFYPYGMEGHGERRSDHIPDWINFIYNSPFYVFIHGSFWVYVFFILSGFVLSIRWFKTRNHRSIYGAVFRRYLRLMLPVLGVHIIYYFFTHIDVMQDDAIMNSVK